MFELIEEKESLPALRPRTTVYAVVHAEPVDHRGSEVSPRGEQQIRELINCRMITSASAIYSAPGGASEYTADQLSSEFSAPVKVIEELADLSVGKASRDDDRLGEELAKMWDDHDYVPPGGESLEQATERISHAANKIASWHSVDSIVIVVSPSVAVLFNSLVTGAHPTLEDWLAMGHASCAILEHHRTSWSLLSPFDNTFLSQPTTVVDVLPEATRRRLGVPDSD